MPSMFSEVTEVYGGFLPLHCDSLVPHRGGRMGVERKGGI